MTSRSSLVDLTGYEQKARDLFFTAPKIGQQMDTWQKTLQIFKENQERICRFLDEAGLRDNFEKRPVVMLVELQPPNRVVQKFGSH